MISLSGAEALLNARHNRFSNWNKSPGSSVLSTNADDASRRIIDAFATVHPKERQEKLCKGGKVFTMGSCFAREIERGLRRRGIKVTSVTDRLNHPAFHDAAGTPRTGYLHRFTPRAMLQEFLIAFGEAGAWSDEHSLIFELSSNQYDDLNYWSISGGDQSLEATIYRRKVASEMVRNAADADIIVLTLGFIESWRHIPTGFYLNRINPSLLVRHKSDFEFVPSRISDVLFCLDSIIELIGRVNNKKPTIFITVSPVPLQSTFTDKDIIIANQDSKSTLRAAAFEFVETNGRLHSCSYFPSYEIVVHSDPRLAWRPDRVHVEPAMVDHIVRMFVDSYYGTDAFE